jgi:hypothetical protein
VQIAEPRNIRGAFQDAEYGGMPLMDAIRLDTMVTVASTTYLSELTDCLVDINALAAHLQSQ